MKHTIELGHEETDINVVLPSGALIQLQYRLECPSIDICLPEPTSVTNWIGDDMKPAPLAGRKRNSHIHKSSQLVIDLNPEFVDKLLGHQEKHMKKIDFEQAAEELHELIRDADADTLASIYEDAFGAVKSCDQSPDGDHFIVEYHKGLEE